MEEKRERTDVLLDVKHLKTHFVCGTGRHKTIIKAVDDVSFQIHQGETFGLVGESGCGKTTLGRTIIRLYEPTSGEVMFHGRTISGRITNDLRRFLTTNIAMVFQDPIASLNPCMTVQEIIGEGLRIRGIKDVNELAHQVTRYLCKVGLSQEHATRYPHEFSGGQRQRIGIARALITEPSLIIMDEPISALDMSIQAQVINILNELKNEMHLTILFIAHDLSVVKYFSDRIGVMYHGKIVELAGADDLYQHPIHPYTKALISSVPLPDPHGEKRHLRQFYDPAIHNYCTEKPHLQEIEKDHYVYCSERESEIYRAQL